MQRVRTLLSDWKRGLPAKSIVTAGLVQTTSLGCTELLCQDWSSPRGTTLRLRHGGSDQDGRRSGCTGVPHIGWRSGTSNRSAPKAAEQRDPVFGYLVVCREGWRRAPVSTQGFRR